VWFSVLKQSHRIKRIKPILREHNRQLRLFLNAFLSSADDDGELLHDAGGERFSAQKPRLGFLLVYTVLLGCC
jgi:hypothetical protein